MISQTNNQFDQLKLEKEHKKAVAREDENAKVNVEMATLGVVSMLCYLHHARPILLRRSPRAQNRIWSSHVLWCDYRTHESEELAKNGSEIFLV